MLSRREELISRSILIFIFLTVILYVVSLQFISPVLYEADGYYHVAIARQIKDSGPHYKFHWAQFSTFKNTFADKDFLFHILIIPFLYLSNNIILAGKYAVIFYNILFILVYIFILRKYLPSFLAGLFLIFLFMSPSFTAYFLYLRPATLSNIFILLGVYCLLHKRHVWLAILSLLYPLAHISFFMMIIFAIGCEIMRYIFYREFCLRNISIVLVASAIGCFIHPNFPHNLLVIYLNAFLVPIYAFRNIGIDFGFELFSDTAKSSLIGNFMVFFSLNLILLLSFLKRIKVSFSTAVWWICTCVYLFLSFLSRRYWYVSGVLFFIFFASYLKDWAAGRPWKSLLKYLNAFIAVYVAVALVIYTLNYKSSLDTIKTWATVNTHYENAARWVDKNIPQGETIYHALWSDSPCFICLSPGHKYLVVLDPIFMYFWYPKVYHVYNDLKRGKVKNPYLPLKSVFKINFGYVVKSSPLYSQIKNDTKHFKTIYNDSFGAVFKIIDTKLEHK
jgi:hypothetical protein